MEMALKDSMKELPLLSHQLLLQQEAAHYSQPEDSEIADLDEEELLKQALELSKQGNNNNPLSIE